MSGRALAYLTDFFGTDSHAEVRKSTLQTAWWELIGSAFGRLGFPPKGRWIWGLCQPVSAFRLFRLVAIDANAWDNGLEVMRCPRHYSCRCSPPKRMPRSQERPAAYWLRACARKRLFASA